MGWTPEWTPPPVEDYTHTWTNSRKKKSIHGNRKRTIDKIYPQITEQETARACRKRVMHEWQMKVREQEPDPESFPLPLPKPKKGDPTCKIWHEGVKRAQLLNDSESIFLDTQFMLGMLPEEGEDCYDSHSEAYWFRRMEEEDDDEGIK